MQKPTLFLMFGYPGAGKTTVAKVIHELSGAVHLSSDQVRLELFPHPEFTPAEHHTLYRVLDQRTEALLATGKSVIYDANLNRYQHRKDKYEICKRTGGQAKLLWVQAPKHLAKERAVHESRSHLWRPDEPPGSMFERVAGVIEEPHADEPYVTIDGTKVTPTYIQDKMLDV